MKTSLKNRVTDWLPNLQPGSRLSSGRGAQLLLPRGWPETNPSVYWWTRGADVRSTHAGREDNVTQLPPALRGRPVHVWTPAGDTLLTRATLPTRSRARIMQALPYALEDQLLDEPENLHFAYVHEPDGALAVAVTKKTRLNTWLEILKSAGVRPTSLCPANLALPLYPKAWSAAFVDNELWIRSGEHLGFVSAATSETPPPLLQAALKEAGATTNEPQQIIVFSPPGGFDADRWSAALNCPVITEATDFWESARPPALNLLQSDFGQVAHLQQLARPLWPAAIMLGLLLAATLVIDVVEWARLRHQHNVYTAEMRDIYRRSFGSDTPFPFEQMQKSMDLLQARSGGPADLLPLLGRVAPAMQSQRGNLKLRGIKYAERALTIDFTLPDYQALDNFKNGLRAANLEVTDLGANKQGDKDVEARLQVQPVGLKAKPKQRS